MNGARKMAPLAAFGFIGLLASALMLVLTGWWQWLAIGAFVLLTSAVIGAVLDSNGNGE